MDRTLQQEYAVRFRAMHHAGEPLVLVNAWDGPSAQAVAASSPAVATSSAGVAASRGYADGEDVPLVVVIDLLERLTDRISVPVSVDLEAGYGESAEEVAQSIEAVLRAGAVGVNMEDGLVAKERKLADPASHAAKIGAARKSADAFGVPIFINARTDTFWLKMGDPGACLEEAIARAGRYADAGADGIFVPGLADLVLIEQLVRRTSLPVNILASANGPSVADLKNAGVRRISTGSWPAKASMRRLGEVAAAVAGGRTLEALVAL